MNPNSTSSLSVHRWVIVKCMIFTLLGMLALDSGLCVTNAFADFSLSPPTLAFTAPVGSANTTGSVTVTNTGSTALTVTYADHINWLVAITPGLSQSIQPGQSGTFTLTASFANLAAGSYSGTATISGGGITQQVPVTLTLFPNSSTGSFSISPSTLAFTATVGSSNKTGSVTVTNTGSTGLTVTYDDHINWLVAITPGLSQTIQPGQSGTFTLTASFANLAAGSYSGTATISGGGITKQVPVTLTLMVTPSTISFITLTPPAPFIQVHQTQPFVATATDASGTPISGLTFTWKSSAPTIASIDSAGLATGLAQGTATITATNGTMTSNSITLMVTPSTISFITLTPPAPSIQVHQTQPFVATATDASGNPMPGLTFTWKSSAPTIASIDSAGLATGLAQGTATITATNGTVTSNPLTLMVTPSTISFITLTPPAPSIQVQQTQPFVATAVDTSGNPMSGLTFTWASISPTVASIDSAGLATGLAQGIATITATNGTVTSNPITLTVTATSATPRVYSTTFPLTENPLSENGNWIGGQTTGLAWADFQSTPGLAFGKQSGWSRSPYDDAIALLTGTWGPNQTVQATVKTVNQNDSISEELEIRLRSTITVNSSTGYECNFSARSSANAYVQIVRWNGPFGDFTLIDARGGTAYALYDGDMIKCTISGNTITAYINGVQKLQVTDSTYSSGNPGIGAYLKNATGVNSDYGFTSLTVSD